MNLTKTLPCALLLALLAAFTPWAVAQSDDTSKPPSKAGLGRAKAKFEKADATLNDVYKTLIATLDKAGAKQLREDEKAWLDYVSDAANHAPGDADPERTVAYWDNMKWFTEDRVAFLRGWTGKDVPPGISGEYDDSYGGSLELEKTKKGIKFDLAVVVGHDSANGEITGIFHLKGNTGNFTKKLEEGEDGPPCELTFTLIDGHIFKVEQKGKDDEAGKGVAYDGTYYKIGKLKKHVEVQ